MEKPPILFLHGAFAGPESGRASSRPGSRRAATVAVPRLPGALAARPRGCATMSRGRWPRPTARRPAGCRRPFARRARRAASRGAAKGRRARARRLARALRPRSVALAAVGAGAGRARVAHRRAGRRRGDARRRGGAARALHRGDAARVDRRGRGAARPREPAGAARRADLGPPGLVPRAAGAGLGPARRPRRLRAGHRPLGDRARLRRGDRADPRRGARAADRPALEEPRLADQRLDRRAPPRRAAGGVEKATAAGRIGRVAIGG